MSVTIRTRLNALRRKYPKKRGLLLYKGALPKIHATRGATLYTCLRSEEDSFAFHRTEFTSERPRTHKQWSNFFRDKVLKPHGAMETPAQRDGILQGAIIPGIERITQQQWDVVTLIGYVPHAIHKSVRAKMATKRHKTKRKRRKNGQTNIRRRHRNRKRKTK